MIDEALVQEVIAEVTEVVQQFMDEVKLPMPTQRQMRQMFDQAMQTPEGMDAFRQQYGDEEFARQGLLGLRRGVGG